MVPSLNSNSSVDHNRAADPPKLNTWIKPLQVSDEDGQVLLLAPNKYILDTLTSQYLTRIKALLQESGTISVELRIGSQRIQQEINRVSIIGATMILTTDNITRFSKLLAFRRGLSFNVPLIESNLFYTGDWRPHFREYSKNELFQLLNWSGFEVLEHQFYEADFGMYLVENGKLIKKDRRKLSLRGRSVKAVNKLAIKFFPHLCDNHILVARKVKSYEEMLDAAPKVVSDLDAWMRQRQAFDN